MTAVSQSEPRTGDAVVDLEAEVPCAMNQCPDVGVAVWACVVKHMDGAACTMFPSCDRCRRELDADLAKVSRQPWFGLRQAWIGCTAHHASVRVLWRPLCAAA